MDSYTLIGIGVHDLENITSLIAISLIYYIYMILPSGSNKIGTTFYRIMKIS